MNIITALGNEKINRVIQAKTSYNIIVDDIQYKEGIVELLEKNNNIDLIIISDILPGEISTLEVIEKIKSINNKIEIIIFLENKNNYLENILKEKNIKNIFFNNEMTINNLIEIINKINLNKKEYNNEIEIIKEIILNNNIKNNNYKRYIYILEKIKKIFNNYLNKIKKNNKKELKSKIINIIGNKKSRENNNCYFIIIKY